MRRNNHNIDIWSKGEVVGYLNTLVENGQIKPCMRIRLEHGHADAYYPRCLENWASRVNATNVATDITAYSAPSSYSWLQCPDDCPHYVESLEFTKTASLSFHDSSDEDGIEISHPKEQLVVEESEPDPSSKITIPWLLKHVPIKLWLAALGIAGAIFVLGIKASQLEIIGAIFNLK